jgi:hypothetical protein
VPHPRRSRSVKGVSAERVKAPPARLGATDERELAEAQEGIEEELQEADIDLEDPFEE